MFLIIMKYFMILTVVHHVASFNQLHNCNFLQEFNSYFQFTYLSIFSNENTGLEQIPFKSCDKEFPYRRWYAMNSREFLYGRKLLILKSTENSLRTFQLKYQKICDINVIFLLFFEEGSLLSTFENVNIPLNCRLIIAQATNASLLLKEVFRLSWDSSLRIIDHGEWSGNRRLNKVNFPYLLDYFLTRANLNGLSLKLGIINEPPLSQLIVKNDSIEYDGIFYHTGKVFMDMMNIRWSIYVTNNNKSIEFPNGSWTGRIGPVQRSEVDLLGYITYSNKLRSGVDHLNVVSTNRIVIFFKLKSVYSEMNYWPKYVKPFHWNIWLTLFVYIILFSLLDTLIYIIDTRWLNFKSTITSFLAAFYSVLGAICQQGGSLTSGASGNRASQKLMVLFIYLFVYLIYVCYSGRVIAYLISFQPELRFKNIDELIGDRNGYRVVANKNNALIGVIRAMKEKKWRKFESKYIEPEMKYLTLTPEGLQNVGTKAKYGYMCFEKIGNFYLSKENYEIIIIPLFRQNLFNSFAINKNSTLKRIFNKNIARLHEVGVLDYIHKLSIGKKSDNSEESLFSSISPEILIFCYTLLASGYILSLFIFIAEIIYVKTKKASTNIYL